MKIVYDKEEEVYAVTLDNDEMATLIRADNIVEAREIFMECMKHLFDNAINEKLK